MERAKERASEGAREHERRVKRILFLFSFLCPFFTKIFILNLELIRIRECVCVCVQVGFRVQFRNCSLQSSSAVSRSRRFCVPWLVRRYICARLACVCVCVSLFAFFMRLANPPPSLQKPSAPREQKGLGVLARRI